MEPSSGSATPSVPPGFEAAGPRVTPAESAATAAAPAVVAAVEPVANELNKRISAFSKAVGKEADRITGCLVELVGDVPDAAVEALSDPTAVTDEDLKKVLVERDPPKIPIGIFRKNLQILRGPVAAVAPAGEESMHPGAYDIQILPPLPATDESFISSLKVGGDMRIPEGAYVAALRAGVADYVGMFNVPEKLKKVALESAKELAMPVHPSYYRLNRLLARRRYGELFDAMGIEGPNMNAADKDELLNEINTKMWPALYSFQQQLVGWYNSWLTSNGMGANPMMMVGAITNAVAAVTGRPSPMPMNMRPPDTAGIRAQAEGTIDQINKIFAGVGIPIAAALAYDASKIKEVLNDPELPMAVGVANKEQMLRKLGISVGADYPDLENRIAQYGFAVVRFPKISGSAKDSVYLQELMNLGDTIAWEKLPNVHSNTREVITRPIDGRRGRSINRGGEPLGIGNGGYRELEDR